MKPLVLPQPEKSPDLLVIAGEESGDAHAAKMVRELKNLQPGTNIYAIGGRHLQASGTTLLLDLSAQAVVGFIEVFRHLFFYYQLLKKTLLWVQTHQPKAIVLVDAPGLNLRLAHLLFKHRLSRKAGGKIRVYYYISPQVWAWKPHRRFQMEQWVDRLAVIFPFETNSFADTSLPVTYVGNPLLESTHRSLLHYNASGPLLLLPGSRKTPVQRIYPILLKTYALLRKQGFSLPAMTLYPNEEIKTELTQWLNQAQFKFLPVSLIPNETAINASGTLMSSGTMSLSCALAGIPGAIVYRTHPITYFLGKLFVKVPYLGIANLLLNKELYPEFIQSKAKPELIAQYWLKYQEEPLAFSNFQQGQNKLIQLLTQNILSSPGKWLESSLLQETKIEEKL